MMAAAVAYDLQQIMREVEDGRVHRVHQRPGWEVLVNLDNVTRIVPLPEGTPGKSRILYTYSLPPVQAGQDPVQAHTDVEETLDQLRHSGGFSGAR
jgi:hypothetical protein